MALVGEIFDAAMALTDAGRISSASGSSTSLAQTSSPLSMPATILFPKRLYSMEKSPSSC